jgi:hypothetical protein
MPKGNGSELIKLSRQIGGKLRAQQEVAQLDQRLIDAVKAMQGLAGEFRKVVDDMYADFQDLKKRVADLEAKNV